MQYSNDTYTYIVSHDNKLKEARIDSLRRDTKEARIDSLRRDTSATWTKLLESRGLIRDEVGFEVNNNRV